MNLYKVVYDNEVITSIKPIGFSELPDCDFKLHSSQNFFMPMLDVIAHMGFGQHQINVGNSWFSKKYITIFYINLDHDYFGYESDDEWLCIKNEMMVYHRDELIDKILR